MRCELSARILTTALILAAIALLCGEGAHIGAWIFGVIVGTGRVLPYAMKQRSGWLFWIICQGCRGPFVMFCLMIATDLYRRDYVEVHALKYIDSLFFFFGYALPCEVAQLFMSLKTGRIVWVEDFVRPMTNDLAQVYLESQRATKPELTLEDLAKGWRQAFFHDADHTHILTFHLVVIGFCWWWMSYGWWREGLLAIAATACCLIPFVWRLPKILGLWGPVLAIGCGIAIAALDALLDAGYGLGPRFTWSDAVFLSLCIAITVKFMQTIASIANDDCLTLDTLAARARDWYLSPPTPEESAPLSTA